MRIVTAEEVAAAVEKLIPQLACTMNDDIRAALEQAQNAETLDRPRLVCEQLLHNAELAEKEHTPLCQDTGSVWVCLTVGPNILVPGDVFSRVQSAVARAYTQHKLRASLVQDALCDRTNTKDNTPAFCDLLCSEIPDQVELSIMLKGGGSDNASCLRMLNPTASREEIIQAVLDQVELKAANACPPLILGLGIGSTFDGVAKLAKHALMRRIGSANNNPDLAQFEAEILERVNALGIGPAALGGTHTALAVHIESAPCHIAAFPFALNMGCIATRRACCEL